MLKCATEHEETHTHTVIEFPKNIKDNVNHIKEQFHQVLGKNA